MKTNLLAPIVLALFAFARALFAQDYMLPIGSNIDNHPTQVGVQITGYRQWFSAVHNFDPSMGELKAVCQGWVKDLARGFVPVAGHEQDLHTLTVSTADGPNAELNFHLKMVNGNWVVPGEIVNFEWTYSAQARWNIQGVTNVTMNLFLDGIQVKHTSTSEGVGDTSCSIAAALSWLTVGVATVDGAFAYPWLKEGWWDGGEVRFDSFDGFATFNVIDGSILDRSDPPPAFLSKLVKPTVPPKVTGLRLRDGLAEISVSTGTARYFVVEYSADFTGESWELVAFSYVGTPNQKVIHYPPEDAKTGFYRVRIPPPSFVKSSGAKIAGKP